MRQISYNAPKNLIKNLVFIDGLNRSGKLLLGSLVSSFKNMESLEFGENFEHFLPAMKFKHVSSNFSKSYLMSYLNQMIYNKMISRNSNFRPYDITSIPQFQSPNIYKKRLKMKEGDTVIKRKKIFVKRKIKTEIFEQLLNAEKKYRNHVYNLRRF
jgi:hypothetical protein